MKGNVTVDNNVEQVQLTTNNNSGGQQFNVKNKLKESRKREYQKQREELVKKLEDAYKIVKNLVEQINEIDETEASDNAILDSVMSTFTK